jgi:hypothetical protein
MIFNTPNMATHHGHSHVAINPSAPANKNTKTIGYSPEKAGIFLICQAHITDWHGLCRS